MIKLKKVRYKNFLAVGNNFIEINLERSKSTLVTGKNGAGKSTIRVAIEFALYGKTSRGNKGELVNSINRKGLLTEIEFEVLGKQYLVRRGIAPNVFEIYCDGTLVNQNSSVYDYQELLEKTILGVSFRSFCQIVAIDSANYTPFMKLNAGARREVVEELLDLKVFSKMFANLKEKQAELKKELQTLELEAKSVRQNIDFTMKQKQIAQEDQESKLKDREELLLNLKNKMGNKLKEKQDLAELIKKKEETLSSQESTLTSHQTKLNNLLTTNRQKLDIAQKEFKFFNENCDCPKCKQIIDSSISQSIKEKLELEIDELTSKIRSLETKDFEAKEFKKKVDKLSELIQEKKKEFYTIVSEISVLTSKIQTLESDIKEIKDQTSLVVEENLKALNQELQEIVKKKASMDKNQKLYERASLLLKENGIKAKVLKKYIPVLNQLVNKYLADLSFNVQFHLNENFEETIKSRYRDVFTYSSFSEGQKQKIDTALIFSWRDIARLRNSVNMNLLFLDESLDSHLDGDATDDLMNLIDRLPESMRIFAISHKQHLSDKFHSQINFELKNNFTKMA